MAPGLLGRSLGDGVLINFDEGFLPQVPVPTRPRASTSLQAEEFLALQQASFSPSAPSAPSAKAGRGAHDLFTSFNAEVDAAKGKAKKPGAQNPGPQPEPQVCWYYPGEDYTEDVWKPFTPDLSMHEAEISEKAKVKNFVRLLRYGGYFLWGLGCGACATGAYYVNQAATKAAKEAKEREAAEKAAEEARAQWAAQYPGYPYPGDQPAAGAAGGALGAAAASGAGAGGGAGVGAGVGAAGSQDGSESM